MKKLILPAVLSLGVVATVHARPMSTEVAFVPGEVVVKVKKGFMGKFLGKKSLLDAELKSSMNLIAGDFVVLGSSSKSTQSLLTQLKHFPEVIYAEPNFIYKAISSNTADPLFEKLWGLSNTGNNEPDRNGGSSGSVGVAGADVNADKAWAITKIQEFIITMTTLKVIFVSIPKKSQVIIKTMMEMDSLMISTVGTPLLKTVIQWMEIHTELTVQERSVLSTEMVWVLRE